MTLPYLESSTQWHLFEALCPNCGDHMDQHLGLEGPPYLACQPCRVRVWWNEYFTFYVGGGQWLPYPTAVEGSA